MAAVVGSASRTKSGKRSHASSAEESGRKSKGAEMAQEFSIKKKKSSSESHVTKGRSVATDANLPKDDMSDSAETEWSSEDLHRLLDAMSAQLPKQDHVKFSTQAEKIDWIKVSFGDHTPTDCRLKWIDVMTKLRRFRTLSELVSDAKEWAKHPWTSFNSKSKHKHPDLPKKPLTPYFRYFLEKREKHSKDHPEMSMTELAKMLAKKFAALPEKKKQKYKDSYERESTNYKAAMEKFRGEHPDFVEEARIGSKGRSRYRGPPKPKTSFSWFLAERMAKHTNLDPAEKKEYEDKYKQQWKALPDFKRVKWIKKAILDEQRYTMEVEEFAQQNPDFKQQPIKSVVTKAEREIKERTEGKPEKPPNSGYSLYSKIMLRELKDIPSKEKMAEISRRWKEELNELERQEYTKQATEAMQRYQEDYAAYIVNLPEDERKRLEEEKRKPKKKAKKVLADETIESKATNNSKPKKPLSALFFFKQEKFQYFKNEYPDKSEQELTRLIAREFGELSEKKKEKYKRMADAAKKSSPENGEEKPKGRRKVSLFEGEPKKPPQSGYVLFTSELIPKHSSVDPKKRMAEISKKWRELPDDDQDKYKRKAADLMRKYQRDLKKFESGLSAEELKSYLQVRNPGKKRPQKPQKKSYAGSKKVKVVATEVKKESDDDNDDDDEDGESDNDNASNNDSESESEEESSDDDSGQSDSGSDSESKSDSDSSSNSDSANTKDGSSDSSSEESDTGDSGSGSDSASDSDK